MQKHLFRVCNGKRLIKKYTQKTASVFRTTQKLFTTYEIQVITGDKRGASTNSTVFLSIFDNNNNEYDVPIEPTASFKRNDTTTLTLENADIQSLQDIRKIRVGHDGENEIGSGWFLDRVIVKHVSNDDSQELNSPEYHQEHNRCHCWAVPNDRSLVIVSLILMTPRRSDIY